MIEVISTWYWNMPGFSPVTITYGSVVKKESQEMAVYTEVSPAAWQETGIVGQIIDAAVNVSLIAAKRYCIMLNELRNDTYFVGDSEFLVEM